MKKIQREKGEEESTVECKRQRSTLALETFRPREKEEGVNGWDDFFDKQHFTLPGVSF